MARVTFKPGQPIQSLSGTIGNLTYRTVYGQTFVHLAREVKLPENPTRADKERFRRLTIANQCVCILQEEISDLQESLRMRPKIRERILGLYKRYHKEIKARTKLQKKIMEEYRKRWCKPR